MEKIIAKLFFLMGIISTFNALIIPFHNTQLALLNFIILFIFMFQFIYRRGNLVFYRYKLYLYFLFLTFIISSIGSVFYLPQVWSNSSIIATVKFCLLLFPFLVLFGDEELVHYRKYFFKGLLISTWTQLIWETTQLIFFYGFHISINEFIFGNLLKIKVIDHSWTFIIDNQFRPSGISWEPANLALALIIGFILTKSVIGKSLFSIGIIMSTSRTGLLVWIICVGIYLVKFLRHRKNQKYSQILFKPWIVISSIIVLLILLYILVTRTNLLEMINHNVQRIIAAINGTDTSSTLHINYYWQSIYILLHSNPFQFLFGYGTTISGFPFSKMFNIFTWKTTAWNPESDFVTVLVGNGLIGCLLYYKLLYDCLKFNKDKWNFCMMILAILFSGILYIYIRSSWSLLICLFLYIKIQTNNSENGNNMQYITTYMIFRKIKSKFFLK